MGYREQGVYTAYTSVCTCRGATRTTIIIDLEGVTGVEGMEVEGMEVEGKKAPGTRL